VTEQFVEDLVARLEHERRQADRLYNDALTALDRAIQQVPGLPGAPAPFEDGALGAVNAAWNILPTGPPHIDRSFKGRLRAFVWRLIGPPLESQKHFNASLVDHINRNVRAQQELPQTIAAMIEVLRREYQGLVRFESLLVQYLQTITLYVDTKNRSLGATDLRDRVALMEQRIMALKRDLEAMGPEKTDRDPFSLQSGEKGSRSVFSGPVVSSRTEAATYVGFEDRFRGSQSEIRGRVEEYVPILASASNVVDIGCGRGELLELLKQRGVTARGVDNNPAMVELCRARGLDVEQDEALGYLERQADGAIGGLSAIQVVEHFEPAYLARFLETAHHKMRPAAPLILETVNPACWLAFFETYIRDLTHARPLHPGTLRYLVQASGFQDVDVQFRQSVGEGDRLDRVAIPASSEPAGVADVSHLAEAINDHADKLNARLFSSMDYVVIARR
jgi:SAM-dependent methyltransferase